MANLCDYDLKAVSKSKESLDRLLKILKGDDPDSYLYKTYSALVFSEPKKSSGDLYETMVTGDMGWDVGNWLNPPFFAKEEGEKLTTLQEICRDLGIAVEIWGREPNMAFQRYVLVDFLGNVSANEEREWNPCAETEEDENGFPEYGEFSSAEEIFVGTLRLLD